MKTTYTECVITQSDTNPIFGEHRIIIRVSDHGAGPFLAIRGENSDPYDGETKNDFFLGSVDEIEEFTEACRAMLKQAEENTNEADTDTKLP